ncbi:hypothetical protein [Compostibacter hankyongensis]|uniref:Uncharacterized protein n=1 Tax=Compostibacter hankyongensis TaxID=1007089 RepID=A0ABP8FND1_9BACT
MAGEVSDRKRIEAAEADSGGAEFPAVAVQGGHVAGACSSILSFITLPNKMRTADEVKLVIVHIFLTRFSAVLFFQTIFLIYFSPLLSGCLQKQLLFMKKKRHYI